VLESYQIDSLAVGILNRITDITRARLVVLLSGRLDYPSLQGLRSVLAVSGVTGEVNLFSL